MRGTWRKFAAMQNNTPTPTQNNTPPAAPLWVEEQVAEYLAIEPRTCRLWRTARGLPFIRISSKAVRYRKADIDAWLDRRRCQTGKVGAR